MGISRINRLTRAFLEIPGVVLEGTSRYGGSPWAVLKKLVLSIRHGYLPEEALSEEMLNPSLPDSEFEKHISRRTMAKIQRQRNPVAWESLLADKSIFYRICDAAGIPVPSVFAIFSRDTPGWTRSGRLLTQPEEWISFLESECPPDFVIKPNRGVYGQGLWFLHRTDGGFIDTDEQFFRAEEIYNLMASNRRSEMFIIQERLRNHEAIFHLSGTDALQTLRVTTVLQAEGTSLVAWAHLKVIGGDLYVDNYRHGELGNFMAEIDTATGVVQRVLLSRGKPMLKHPKTGLPIVGFQIPFWNETCALAKRCALNFSPIGTVGWDVAVTSHGPVMIEGNIWYDPPSPPDIAAFLSAFQPQGSSTDQR